MTPAGRAGQLVLALWLAFSNVEPGARLPEVTLVGLDGAKRPYLGKAKVNVFFFFVPGTRHAGLALAQLAVLEQEFSGKSVAWVGLVSSTVPEADTRALVEQSKLAAPVLVDPSDSLYGQLGTAMTPVLGVADEAHRLLAYLPFTKLQYQDTIRAWVRRGLGELTEEQLRAALAPAAALDGGEVQVARRYLKMAERLLKENELEKALGAVQKALEHAPNLAAAHAQLGAVLVGLHRCPEAAAPLDKALELEPANEVARDARRACQPDGGSR